MKPGEAVKKKDGRDTVQLGKCNTLPVNTIPVAYVMRRIVSYQKIFYAALCTYGENELHL